MKSLTLLSLIAFLTATISFAQNAAHDEVWGMKYGGTPAEVRAALQAAGKPMPIDNDKLMMWFPRDTDFEGNEAQTLMLQFGHYGLMGGVVYYTATGAEGQELYLSVRKKLVQQYGTPDEVNNPHGNEEVSWMLDGRYSVHLRITDGHVIQIYADTQRKVKIWQSGSVKSEK